jgi:uncharacterized protein (TIGR02246 family)
VAKSLRETIEQLSSEYTAALNRPRAEGAGEFFTEDADLLPPGRDNFHGREQIQAFWTAATEALSDPLLTTNDVTPIGDAAAREIGTYWARVKGTDGATVSGKYVFIWRKVGGEWKIWTDIWTSHEGQS